jgi:hypothetical protein
LALIQLVMREKRLQLWAEYEGRTESFKESSFGLRLVSVKSHKDWPSIGNGLLDSVISLKTREPETLPTGHVKNLFLCLFNHTGLTLCYLMARVEHVAHKEKEERLPKLVLKTLWRKNGGMYLEMGQNLKSC